MGQPSTKSCPRSLSCPGKGSRSRARGRLQWEQPHREAPGSWGSARSPRSNSEQERCVAIGTPLNTVTLVTTATRSRGARARPCAPRSESSHPAPRTACCLPHQRCRGDQGAGTDPDHRTTRAVGNHHRDQSREPNPSRASGTRLATDSSVQRCALSGLPSPPVPPVTEPPSAPHVEPEL